MKQAFTTSLVIALAVGSVAATPSETSAQASAKAKKVTLAPSVSVTATGGAWKRKISVSVLGGYSLTGSQLYYFPSPFDPISGVFSPNNKQAIGPSAIGNGRKLWQAGANSTTLGAFRPGQELVFGLWLPNNTWMFSGAVNAQAVGLKQLASVVPKSLLVNNPAPAVAGVDYEYYGWAMNGQSTQPDYNDFVFMTSQATVTPEPATLSLLGLGLVGLGGFGVRRRRKA